MNATVAAGLLTQRLMPSILKFARKYSNKRERFSTARLIELSPMSRSNSYSKLREGILYNKDSRLGLEVKWTCPSKENLICPSGRVNLNSLDRQCRQLETIILLKGKPVREEHRVTSLLLKITMIERVVPTVAGSLMRQQLRDTFLTVRIRLRIRIREWDHQEEAKVPLEDDL